METFGQKLRQALELSGLRPEAVAEATGLEPEHIQALERDDFSALPDDDIVRKGLQAFARLVDVDPDQVIADYSQQRQRWLAAAPPVVAEVASEPSKPRAGRGVGITIPVLAVLGLAIVAFLFWPRSSTAIRSAPSPAVEKDRTPVKGAVDPVPVAPVVQGGMEASAQDTPSPPAEAAEPEPAIGRPIGDPGLSIPEHGVGKGVVDNQLVGETGQFAEGERVWFWTLVEGGAAGESIHHVWIHEGEDVHDVPVRLGGSRWRTHSFKTLNPGSAGSWAVEARDRAGRVLARREFRCSPRDG